MIAIVPRRPLAVSAFPSSVLPRFGPAVSQRYESSSRRTTKRLRVKPDPSLTSTIPFDKINDHIVFNPPSSAPSVYHTPLAFLPADDPRRKILAQSHEHANPYDKPDQRLPPLVRPASAPKRYHLNEADIAEIRRLRTEDPFTWTRGKLAEKFDCSQFFVGLVCEASRERKEQQKQNLENVKEKWGRRKRHAREDRAKRRESWGRDE